MLVTLEENIRIQNYIIFWWNKLYIDLNLNLSQLSKSFINRYLILKEIVC